MPNRAIYGTGGDPLDDDLADKLQEKCKNREPYTAVLKVVRGDICCKSLDHDQSYGMWVPVAYSTEHGFVDGTCFYTSALPDVFQAGHAAGYAAAINFIAGG